MKHLFIPLSKLVNSPLNVRTVDTGKVEDKELIASIKHHGLLQNIVVIPKGKTRFEVVAGGRRLSALHTLLAQKDIEAHYPVSCLVTTRERATEVSLSENINRVDMHPADQLSAFLKLLDDGASIADISMSFGKTKAHVKRVLALAKVHPELIQAFKKNEIDMECLEAFTVTSDTKKQLDFYKTSQHINAFIVRRALTENGYSSNSLIATLCTKKRYLEEGGVVTADLFNGTQLFEDGEIVRSIVLELLKEASKVLENKGWGWITCDGWGDYSEYDYVRMRGEYSDIPASLVDKLSEKQNKIENMRFDDDSAEEEDKLLNDLLDEKEKYLHFSDQQKKYSGVVVTFNERGIVFKQGVAHEKDMKTFMDVSTSESGKEESIESNTERKDEPLYSQALVNDLVLEDTQLSQLNMMQNPQLSTEAFMFDFCYTLLSESELWRHTSVFSFDVKHMISNDERLIESIASTEIQKLKKTINTSWLKDSVEDSYTAFIELSLDEQLKLFGQVTALSVDSSAKYCEKSSIYAQLHKRSGFKKTSYWNPTKKNFFSRLKLNILQDTCIQLFGEVWMKEHINLKKSLLAELAEKSYLNIEPDKKAFLPDVMV